MIDKDVEDIAAWLAEAGLTGADEATLARTFCERVTGAGLPIGRGLIMIDTLHPLHESRAFFFEDGPARSFREEELPFSRDAQGTNDWRRSPFFHMVRDRRPVLRHRLEAGDTGGYSALEELAGQGQKDWLAIVHTMRAAPRPEDAFSFYARWTTARAGGFGDAEVATLVRLSTLLGLAIRAANQARLARSLMQAYLGRDPAQRVLRGRIIRGEVDRISAVLWFSDLSGYTQLSERIASADLIPLLNDYAEVAISAIHAADGDVLKLIGDGILAIFAGTDPAAACLAAMRAEHDMRERLIALNLARKEAGKPVAGIYLGLHIGDVFYGNIGSPERLDFTVVGPAVNEVSRIASMCTSVSRQMLCSSEFAEWLPDEERRKLVSVGRFALRGVGRAKELFTLDPELVPAAADIASVGVGTRPQV